MEAKLVQKLKNLPSEPGCYKFYDKTGKLLYVGKAKNLKKRVGSYFLGRAYGNTPLHSPKTDVLVSRIADIKWEIAGSEIEALITESLLIKKYRPAFNIKIKDDKDFLWVKVDLSQDFPYPELVRRPVGARHAVPLQKIFGPFTDAGLLQKGIAILRKIFLWRDCSEAKFNYYKKRGKPCLEYYIKNCSAPCAELTNKNDYYLGIKHLIVFLEGKKVGLTRSLQKEMKRLAKKKMFEQAALVRDKLRALEHMDASLKSQKLKVKSQNYGVPSARYIKNIINILNHELGYKISFKPDFRIEFYDISNIAGKEATGAMVVWQGGGFAKDQYRRFRIRFVKRPNDVLMLREVLSRRIKRIMNDELRIMNKTDGWSSPDLIILDGGKPQLGEIGRLFQQLKVNIPMISLAKENEEVWGVNQKSKIKNKNYGVASRRFDFKGLNINKDSPEGFFLQRLRDEAHRFAISYHKVLRSEKIIKSRLDEIAGIGPRTKKKLLREFGSIAGIINADEYELGKIVGEKLADKIKENL